jgi:hypothetical protein
LRRDKDILTAAMETFTGASAAGDLKVSIKNKLDKDGTFPLSREVTGAVKNIAAANPDGMRKLKSEAKYAADLTLKELNTEAVTAADIDPADTALTVGPPALSGLASGSFGFSSSETNSSFECSLDAAPFAVCASPFEFLNLADGSHSFSVRAIDKTGNVDDTPAGHAWLIDTAAPVLALTGPGTDWRTSKNAVTIKGTVEDALTTSVTITGGGLTYTPQVTNGSFVQEITFLGENTWPITVTAIDEVGNRSELSRAVICSTPDLNGDGIVDIGDGLLALRMAVGLTAQPTGAQLFRGDVAPMLNGMPSPDGRIDVGDALVMLRKVVGLIYW